MYKKTNNRGITLLEILMSISVLALVSFLLFSPLSTYQNTQVLNTDTDIVVSMMHDARTKTIEAEGASRYGVHVEADKVVSFVGPTYDPDDPTNDIYMVDGLVSISDVALVGGGNEVVFDLLTGETDTYGTITVSLISNQTKFRTITIYQTGITSR